MSRRKDILTFARLKMSRSLLCPLACPPETASHSQLLVSCSIFPELLAPIKALLALALQNTKNKCPSHCHRLCSRNPPPMICSSSRALISRRSIAVRETFFCIVSRILNHIFET
ncbi:hypothetical protein M407DRAFT_90625 [Tulasnella calospora MUT 4182]|uniref:Uncharacterized protein n=1 Tax=Tulasnella calospora MUT 4182 TaxID=1051891 RepID=A0A0C3QU90_9AGAM|nr:hypothetical protein M407DRAFT_90625 [Tulasnella calospora MUT 4182]